MNEHFQNQSIHRCAIFLFPWYIRIRLSTCSKWRVLLNNKQNDLGFQNLQNNSNPATMEKYETFFLSCLDDFEDVRLCSFRNRMVKFVWFEEFSSKIPMIFDWHHHRTNLAKCPMYIPYETRVWRLPSPMQTGRALFYRVAIQGTVDICIFLLPRL